VSIGFEMPEEPGDALGGEIAQLKCLDSPMGIFRHVAEQQKHRIAVTAESMNAHPSLSR
jgi:hypothetical protein